MDSFRVEWKRSAIKELRKLPRDAIRRITDAVTELANEPFPVGARKLAGSEHSYRIRIGSYRVVYNVELAAFIIQVIRVGHRKDIYKK